ncbi:MAG: SWIM zinc finger family protein [Gemmatimonadota bacterium]
MSDWWKYEKPRPRRTPDAGMRARSRRGVIGGQWWSRRFVAGLEEVADRKRLARGRSYARTGQVMDVSIAPGAVIARVQGSRRAPYEVRLEVEPFTSADWQAAEAAMGEQAIFMAALLAGDMPSDIEDAFAAAGLSLFPASPDDLRATCSCPDWGNPCKHAAAALYILAEKFDDDPFLIFAWRGREKDALIESLRRLRGASVADLPGESAPIAPEEAAVAHDDPPLADLMDRFWSAGPALEQIRLAPRAPAVPDAVLRQLGPLPLDVRGEPVDRLLSRAYEAATRAAQARALEGE